MSTKRRDSGEVPEEIQRRLPHDPRLYMANYWDHPSRPQDKYDFKNADGSEHLTYLTHDDSHLNPQNWGDVVVLLFARGCLKTTSCVAIANWATDMYMHANVEGTVTAPRRDQTSEVMNLYKDRVEESGLDAYYERDKQTHQKFQRTYERADGSTYSGKAELKARSAWGEGDALRGIHSHFGIIDEFQDVDEGMFSTFLEAVDQEIPAVPYFPTIFVIGTPKMANTFFEDLWKMSDQKDWDPETKQWVSQSEAEEFLNEGQPDGEGFKVTGWHIDQPSCPLHEGKEIAFKKRTYNPKKLENEVYANFYSAENDMLTREHVEAMLDDTAEFRQRRQFEESTVTMGVDWGGGSGASASDTVMVVGETHGDGYERMTDILAIDFVASDLSKQDEVELVEDYIMRYDVDAVVVDEGYGAKQREDLQDGNNTRRAGGYKELVSGCLYGRVNEKDRVKWKTDDKRMFTCDRTHMMQWFVSDAKDGKVSIPSKSLDFSHNDADGLKLMNQLTAPYTDADTTPSGKNVLKVLADRNDDAFHAFTYMWIAANRLGSRRTLRSIVTHEDY